MKAVLITPRSLSEGNDPGLDRIRSAGFEIVFPSPGRQPTEAELIGSIGEAVGYLAGVERIGARVLDAAKNLRVISRNGTGVDNIDMGVAMARGIRVLRAEGANARGVAELAFGHLIACARGLAMADSEIKAGRWVREKGFELEGKTLSIIGCGKIGRIVARFALAFDMNVLAYDLYPDASFSPSPNFAWASLEEALVKADAITLHCSPAADGKPLLGEAAISSLKKGVVVVNTAREGLIEKGAMLSALNSGRVRSYAVDAFDEEPPRDRSLPGNKKVIATPHLGGFTAESVDRATAAAVDNLLRALGEGSA
jgi:D-3-phosphoglycerate dehydrogenase / 2-oxoglutarate reductase